MIVRSSDEVFELGGSVWTESYAGSVDTKNGFEEYISELGSTTQSATPVEPMVSVWYHFTCDLLWSRLWKRPQRPGINSKRSSSVKRTDSDVSLISLAHTKRTEFETEKELFQPPDPIHLVLAFEDHTHTKLLDYATFARWQRVEALLLELESDGIWVNCLWDVVEDMQVTHGDWDARVRPGWKVHASCTDCGDSCGYPNDRGDDSSVDEDGDGGWTEDDYEQREWWFARWRHRVESRRSRSKCIDMGQEPSWRMIIAVCGLMVPFFWAMAFFMA